MRYFWYIWIWLDKLSFSAKYSLLYIIEIDTYTFQFNGRIKFPVSPICVPPSSLTFSITWAFNVIAIFIYYSSDFLLWIRAKLYIIFIENENTAKSSQIKSYTIMQENLIGEYLKLNSAYQPISISTRLPKQILIFVNIMIHNSIIYWMIMFFIYS